MKQDRPVQHKGDRMFRLRTEPGWFYPITAKVN